MSIKKSLIRYQLTPLGNLFLFSGSVIITLFILYLGHASMLLSVWLALWLMQLVWPRIVLRIVQLRMLPVARVFYSGEDLIQTISIQNRSSLLPAGSFEIQPEMLGRMTEVPRVHVRRGPAPGETMDLDVSFGLATRGRRYLRIANISSSAPFGLLRAYQEYSNVGGSLIVWCSQMADCIKQRSGTAEAMRKQSLFALRRKSRAARSFFAGIRTYQPGDSTASIHWRLSAKAGELVILEKEDLCSSRYWLLIEAQSPEWSKHVHFESMLSIASTVLAELYKNGLLQGVVINGRVLSISNRHKYMVAQQSLAVQSHPGEGRGRKTQTRIHKNKRVLEFVLSPKGEVQLVDQSGRCVASSEV